MLLVYAEGGRSRSGQLGEPKPGIGRIALESGAPIVPVAIVVATPHRPAVTAPAAAVPPRRRWLWAVAAVAVIAVVAAAAILVRSRSESASARPAAMRISRVTASGKVISASMSADKRFLAYVISDQGEQSLWVRQMPGGQSLELIPPQRQAYWGVAFGPDGSIFYGIKSQIDPLGAIYQISPLGGQPRMIISGIDSPPTFSPDGKRMAFLRARSPQANESSIVVANVDGTGGRVLAAVRAPEFFVPIFYAAA